MFEELFHKLYGEASQHAGSLGSIPITCHDAQNIASSADIVPYPIIRQIKGKTFSDYRQVMQDIQKSYSKQGRTVKHLSTARTTFTFVTTSMKTREDNPLSDYVYKTIKESLEDVFGSIR